MRIACTATSLVPSSTANSIQVMKVCQSLADNGHTVCLWVPGAQNAPWEELAAHYGLSTAFEVRWLPANRMLKRYDFAISSYNEARRWQADLVYSWLPQSAAFACWRGMPAILELHDRPMGRLGPAVIRQFAAMKGKKRIAVITRALQLELEKSLGRALPAEEICVAPNGINLAQYRDLPSPEQARRELGLPEGITAMFAGHLYAGRGAGLLHGLAKALPQVQFLWVGGNPADVSAWREKLAADGISNVTLTGFVENRRLPLYQAAGDILLMPYERKIAGSSGGNSADICSPMKMFDYLATGRAILTSELPVLHEVLNERNAVFCPPEDLSAWTDALLRLAGDAALRDRLARQARHDAQQYDWQARAQKVLEGF